MTERRSRRTTDPAAVRPGRQTRSQRTQAALLDAAGELFGERGVDATTIADIAERAGCSVGSFYHHFRDKRAVQDAVVDRFASDAERATLAAIAPPRWDGASIGEILRAYLVFSVRRISDGPPFGRAVLEVTRSDPGRFDRSSAVVDQGLRDLLMARRAEIGHSDPELAVTHVLHLLASVLRARLDHPSSSPRYGLRSDEAFARETTRAACCYLDVAHPPDA